MDYTFYKLQSINPEIADCYIGSTENFTTRKRNHKSDCNTITSKRYNLKVYVFIRLNGGFDTFTFEIIDIIKFTKTDALLHETKLMNLYGSTLNTYKALTTEEDKIEYRAEYHKKYEKEHRKQLNQYQRDRYLKKKLNK